MPLPRPTETGEAEDDVVALLNRQLRVIRTAEHRKLQRPGPHRGWVTFARSQTKVALLMRIKDQLQRKAKSELPLDRLAGRYCDADSWAVVEALPDFFQKETCQ